ncbi:MAG TPA: hypothetical protein DCE44_10770 [Verrucomicrobiales bacterium]|nr:hypothetical protein [Verrucomicrobiales bacterium]
MFSPRRLIGLLALLAVCLGVLLWRNHRRTSGPARAEAAAEAAARAYLELEAREQSVDASLWLPELEAERHEDAILHLWDTLNASANPWTVLAQFPVAHVVLPKVQAQAALADGTQVWMLVPPPPGSAADLNHDSFIGWLSRWEQSGWILGRTTWALTRHQPATPPSRARSKLAVTVQLNHSSTQERASLRFGADLTWDDLSGPIPVIERLEVEHGELLTRRGRTPFQPWFEDSIPADRSIFTDPLLVWDLDGEGFSEIIMVGADRVWRNRPDPSGKGRRFEAEPWLGLPREHIVAAVRADVNADGEDDLVLAQANGVVWWPGKPGSGPTETSVSGWVAPLALKHAQVITAGDVDGDGDLDLWVAQYKLPYQGGQFPTPWDDANDGFPAYLLRNDGAGHFVDATTESGLAPGRFRRTYSASFVDLDIDGDLDLVNVSDFAGLDVFLNDGAGHFQSVTDKLGVARHAFGMSHTVNDVNRDGRPDVLMLGMNSTVADRLGVMNLERNGSSIERMREMTVGNRLFLGQSGVIPLQVAPTAMAHGLARTGWSWGAALADFNSDGNLDLAVANGHETRASVRDYERQFWRHDRFAADSQNNVAADLYFRTAAGRRQADQASYGGWQNNVLLLGDGTQGWTDVAWLWGVAVPADCRNHAAEDLDGDGRLDLVVTTQEEWPERRQRLLIFHNESPAQSWIGFKLSGPFPSGARFELETSAGSQTRWCLTGDGYRTQSSSSVHFGLGSGTPRSLRIQVPGRGPRVIEPLTIKRWEAVKLVEP